MQRQYSGTLGKIDNCQIAVTAALLTGVRAWLVGAELYLPQGWLTRERRQHPGTLRRRSVPGAPPSLVIRLPDVVP